MGINRVVFVAPQSIEDAVLGSRSPSGAQRTAGGKIPDVFVHLHQSGLSDGRPSGTGHELRHVISRISYYLTIDGHCAEFGATRCPSNSPLTFLLPCCDPTTAWMSYASAVVVIGWLPALESNRGRGERRIYSHP